MCFGVHKDEKGRKINSAMKYTHEDYTRFLFHLLSLLLSEGPDKSRPTHHYAEENGGDREKGNIYDHP
jgi:hypothetical protein